jgi:cytochrome b involved in lipid metabolism
MNFIKWLRRSRVHCSMASYTRAEVALHNKAGDCWIIMDSVVYDVSSFLAVHPGGHAVIMEHAGKDCTDAFNEAHCYVRHEDVLFNEVVGVVVD